MNDFGLKNEGKKELPITEKLFNEKKYGRIMRFENRTFSYLPDATLQDVLDEFPDGKIDGSYCGKNIDDIYIIEIKKKK